MNRYRISFKEIRENNSVGFKSQMVWADTIIDAVEFLFLQLSMRNSTAQIYSIIYLPDGIE